MVIPNFIVVGAAKSGTTSLWHYLMSHPDIFMPAIKETNYFSHDLMNRNNPIRSLADYESLFNGKENYKLRGEVSNSYLNLAKDIAPRIKNLIPDCLILIIIRHPVERLYSRYWHAVRDQYIDESFSVFSKKVKEKEIISNKIDIYKKIFGKDKVKIVYLEDFQKKLDFFASELFSFLGVTQIPLSNSHLNKSGRTRWKFFNDFVLNGYAEVCNLHAHIYKKDNQVFIENEEEGSEILVNYRQIDQQAMKKGDVIKIGTALLQYYEI